MTSPPRTLSQRRLRRAALAAACLASFAVGWSVLDANTNAPPSETLERGATTEGEFALATLQALEVSTTDAAAPSERRVVADAPPQVMHGFPPEIRLRVVDADTGADLEHVTVREHSVAVAARSTLVSETDSGWLLSPAPGISPGPEVDTLPIIAASASPLRCPTRARTVLWISAQDHGWARLALFEPWPEEVTVELRRSASLEVVVTTHATYRRLMLVLTPLDDDGAAIRRTAREGRARFDGLRGGEYELLVKGVRHGDALDRDTLQLNLGALERRREVLDLRTRWGELELVLREPVDRQGGTAFAGVRVVSLDPDVPADQRTRDVLDFVSEEVSGERVHTLAEPLVLAGGPTRVRVLPHGLLYELEVHAEQSVVLERSLPVLARRRVLFQEQSTGVPFAGVLVVHASEEQARSFRETLLLEQRLDSDDGSIEGWWPAVPFTLSLGYYELLADESLASWPAGHAIPDGLRIDVRRPEEDELDELRERFLRVEGGTVRRPR